MRDFENYLIGMIENAEFDLEDMTKNDVDVEKYIIQTGILDEKEVLEYKEK